jgi:hypothetical protein
MSSGKNDKLRAAREGTPSRLHPGCGLTRAELATLVADHVWEHHGVVCPVDAKYVAKLEAGRIRWPGARYRAALRAILDRPTDEALGFRNTSQARAAPRLPRARPRPDLRPEPDVVGSVLRRLAELQRLDAELTERPTTELGERAVLRARELLGAVAHFGLRASRVAFEDDYPLDARLYLDGGGRAAVSAGAEALSGEVLVRALTDEAEDDDGTTDPVGRTLASRPKVLRPDLRRPRQRDHRYLRCAPWLAQAGLRPHDVDAVTRFAVGVLDRGVLAQAPPRQLDASRIRWFAAPPMSRAEMAAWAMLR